jgi:hypothetical protein
MDVSEEHVAYIFDGLPSPRRYSSGELWPPEQAASVPPCSSLVHTMKRRRVEWSSEKSVDGRGRGPLILCSLISSIHRKPINWFLNNLVYTVWGCYPHTQPPTWRTRVSIFVWLLPLDLFGMDNPASSYATASIALRVSGALKPHHHDKAETPLVGTAQRCLH